MARYKREPDITIAWAIRVDEIELAARLEAYEETYQQILTLRLCHRAQTPSILSGLPVVMVNMVVDSLFDPVYAERKVSWELWARGRINKCSDGDHLSFYKARWLSGAEKQLALQVRAPNDTYQAIDMKTLKRSIDKYYNEV